MKNEITRLRIYLIDTARNIRKTRKLEGGWREIGNFGQICAAESRLIGEKRIGTGDRLIWKKAVALWQSRWLWFADRAVFAAFACFFTRHHSETLLSRGAITGTRDEQHAAAVVPRRRWTKTTATPIQRWRTRVEPRAYEIIPDNIPDSGHCAKRRATRDAPTEWRRQEKKD